MAVAGSLLLALAPVWAVVLGAVGVDMLRCPRDRGRLFYRERRISCGRPFDLLKLRTLPIDRLKIDRSFVAELAGKGLSNELVEAIVSLGRGLSVPVTAEGVESAAILEKLQGMGQLKGQGYLYGYPEDGAATRERLAGQSLLTGSEVAPAPPPLSNSERKHSWNWSEAVSSIGLLLWTAAGGCNGGCAREWLRRIGRRAPWGGPVSEAHARWRRACLGNVLPARAADRVHIRSAVFTRAQHGAPPLCGCTVGCARHARARRAAPYGTP